jgi:hypothetical protein
VIRDVQGVRFLDQFRLWEAVRDTTIVERSRALMELAGVQFWDDSMQLISKPSVAVLGIGGIPISWPDDAPENTIGLAVGSEMLTLAQLQRAMYAMAGFGACQTYLNPNNRSPEDLFDTACEAGHFSIGHVVSVNLGVFGVSTAVENEFNAQRDLIHLCRLTEARAAAQSRPPVVVLDAKLAPVALKALSTVESSLSDLFRSEYVGTREQLLGSDLAIGEPVPRRRQADILEACNILYPAAKGTLFIISATLRNLQKLVGGRRDPSNEIELSRCLEMIEEQLCALAPKLFCADEASSA